MKRKVIANILSETGGKDPYIEDIADDPKSWKDLPTARLMDELTKLQQRSKKAAIAGAGKAKKSKKEDTHAR